jgi:general secretion pathway protein I
MSDAVMAMACACRRCRAGARAHGLASAFSRSGADVRRRCRGIASRHSRECGNPCFDVAVDRGSALSRGRHREAPPARRSGGFSLLEVLVAFVILAVVGSVLSQLYSSSLRNAGAAEEWSRAVLVAEGHLASAAATYPLKEGSNSGTEDDGRVTWTTKVEPYVAPDTSQDLLNASAQLPISLLRVSVNVSFPGASGADRTVAMSTVKLVRKDLQ